MRGFELTQAQVRRLAELRRELAGRIGYTFCLDEADLTWSAPR